MSIPAAHIAAPGTVVAGKYRLERLIGEGGMAVVYEAINLSLGSRVALKFLRAGAGPSSDAFARFRREALISAQLPGEHIVRVSDIGTAESGAPFLVMELLTGHDLERELERTGPLPVATAVDYLLQACEGVAEAHVAGLVHRDLKPSNLFLVRRRDDSHVVKVLDFGISKVAPSMSAAPLTATSTNFGTPLYMSPEQIQSAKHVDARSDQHALAAILYTMVCGIPPFDAESLTALAVLIATRAPKPMRELRPEVPPPLDDAVARALAKAPEDRFADLAGLAAALAPFGTSAAVGSARRIAATLAEAADAPDAARGGRVASIVDPSTPAPTELSLPPPGDAPALPQPAKLPQTVPSQAAQMQATEAAVQRVLSTDPSLPRRPVALFAVLAAGAATVLGAAFALRAGGGPAAQPASDQVPQASDNHPSPPVPQPAAPAATSFEAPEPPVPAATSSAVLAPGAPAATASVSAAAPPKPPPPPPPPRPKSGSGKGKDEPQDPGQVFDRR